MTYGQIKFGDLVIGPLARRRIADALDRNWVTEGPNVREFEEKYAEKFGWKHCISTSSGTTAGEVVWAAIRELKGFDPPAVKGNDLTADLGWVTTPACAFAATANCVLAAGLEPWFVDVNLETLNIDPKLMQDKLQKVGDLRECAGIQFVATMGKPTPIIEAAKIAEERDLYLVGDFCEAHGAKLIEREMPIEAEWVHDIEINADHYCDAAIYSFYVAHLIQGGEGGCVCTDDDEIADLCRSIKSHGRPPRSNYFDFQRIGFNAKWTDLAAAIALESLEKFDETFGKRREVRRKLIEALSPFEDRLILYRDAPGEVIAPHAFCVTLRDETGDIMPLYRHMEENWIEVKKTFGSLPTQHAAFSWMGHKLGDFPIAERIGRTSLHLGCHEGMMDEDVGYVHDVLKAYFEKESRQWQQDNCRHSSVERYGGHTYCVSCEKEFPHDIEI